MMNADEIPVVRSEDTEKWKNFHQDWLEPQFYPDPGIFRASLIDIAKDDKELMTNMTSNKATIRVLAPYLKIMRKEKKKLIETALKQKAKRERFPYMFYEKNKPKGDFSCVIPDLTEKLELTVSIHETADVLQSILEANYVVSYIVNPSRNELYQSPRHVTSSASNLTCAIEAHTTMAAHAAFTKQHVISDNISADPRFSLGLGYPGSIMKHALCVPIKTPDDRVVAVYEIVRDTFQSAFEPKEVQVVLALAGWMGAAILQNALYTYQVRSLEMHDYLLQITTHYHSGLTNLENTMSDLIVFARETVGAERCFLYVAEGEVRGLKKLEEYEQGPDNSRLLYKRRAAKYVGHDGSMLSKVVMKREVYNSHQLVTEVHFNTEHKVRSALCVPIISNNDVIGAIQLTNKRTAVAFNEEDIQTLKLFATYCAPNLSYLKVNEKMKKSEMNYKVMNEMLFHHIKPCIHDQEGMRQLSDELPENFFTFSWYPSPDQVPKLIEFTINMFHEVLGDSFMALNNIPKFVLTVKNCYRPNPYHNYTHAFTVAHAMANIVSRYSRIFTGLERKGLLVAALCHDVDHRGYNNNFIQLTKHYLSTLYDSSPLENHHFAVTKMILHQCGMFKYLKPEMYNDLLTEIYECIIATDLSLYFQTRMELMRIADEQSFTFKNREHRKLVKSIMMTACDLSGQTKPLAVCKKITEDVYEEFYQQGDVEKKMGFIPLPTMDRDLNDMVPENQVQFMSIVVLPCVETLSRIFTTLSPMVWDTRGLLKQWKEIVEMKSKNTWKPEDSFPSSSV